MTHTSGFRTRVTETHRAHLSLKKQGYVYDHIVLDDNGLITFVKNGKRSGHYYLHKSLVPGRYVVFYPRIVKGHYAGGMHLTPTQLARELS